MQVTDNSPSTGYIAWSSVHISYLGSTYTIADGNTNCLYVYWLYASPTTFQVSNTFPSLGSNDILVFLNKNGIHATVPNTTVIDGSMIVPESILTNALSANCVTATQLAAGSVTANAIAANSIGANAIAANAITANKLAIGDFSNLADMDEVNGTTVNTQWGYSTTPGDGWNHFISPSNWPGMMMSNQKNPLPFEPGDQIYFTFDAIANTATTVHVAVWVFTTTTSGDGDSGNACTFTVQTSASTYSGVISVPNNYTRGSMQSYTVGLWTDNDVLTESVGLKVKNIRFNRMYSGSLIVDGAIDGQTINGVTITGSIFTATGQDKYDTDVVQLGTSASGGGEPITVYSTDNPEGDIVRISSSFVSVNEEDTDLDNNLVQYDVSMNSQGYNASSTVTSDNGSGNTYVNSFEFSDGPVDGTYCGTISFSQYPLMGEAEADDPGSSMNFYESGLVFLDGSLTVNSSIVSYSGINCGGTDFDLGTGGTGRGNGGRALVQQSNNTLVINYSNDFGGTVRVDSALNLNGGNKYIGSYGTPGDNGSGQYNKLSFGEGDAANLGSKGDVNIDTWYGFTVCPSISGSNVGEWSPAFVVDARLGNITAYQDVRANNGWLYGNSVSCGNEFLNGGHVINSVDGGELYFESGTGSGGNKVGLNAAYFSTSSTLDIKNSVALMDTQSSLDRVTSTDVVTFKYNMDTEKNVDKPHIGFIVGGNYNLPDYYRNYNDDGVLLYDCIGDLFGATQQQELNRQTDLARLDQLEEQNKFLLSKILELESQIQ